MKMTMTRMEIDDGKAHPPTYSILHKILNILEKPYYVIINICKLTFFFTKGKRSFAIKKTIIIIFDELKKKLELTAGFA